MRRIRTSTYIFFKYTLLSLYNINVISNLKPYEPPAKRRRKSKLIVDKNIKLSAAFLRERIQNQYVELRCENSTDDIIFVGIPSDLLFRQTVHNGWKFHTNVGAVIKQVYLRNLSVGNTFPFAEREIEVPLADKKMSKIVEVEETERPLDKSRQVDEFIEDELNIMMANMNITVPNIVISHEQDISMLPTQKLQTLSQQKRKQTMDDETALKRHKNEGYVSFRESQHIATGMWQEMNKGNVLCNEQVVQPVNEAVFVETHITSMLQAAELSNVADNIQLDSEARSVTRPNLRKTTLRGNSESSETPLGSLDRTKVSLGDSDETTDSQRFIRDQWGTEGTMMKILKMIKNNQTPVNIKTLVDRGPLVPGHKSFIAAHCFSAVLKLKQHGFIRVRKVLNTSEIDEILLGPVFDLL